METLLSLLPFIPEPWRTYVGATVAAVLAVVAFASAVTAKTPAPWFSHPLVGRPLRILSWLSAFAPKDGAGTLKLPGTTPHDPGAMLDLAKIRDAVAPALGAGAKVDDIVRLLTSVLAASGATPRAVDPSKVPPAIQPRDQRGAVRVGALVVISGAMIVATVVGAVLTGCPNWNRPACPRPGVRTCVSDQPHLCSPTGELTPIGDEPCGAQRRVCALDDAGVAYCARGAADGGAQ